MVSRRASNHLRSQIRRLAGHETHQARTRRAALDSPAGEARRRVLTRVGAGDSVCVCAGRVRRSSSDRVPGARGRGTQHLFSSCRFAGATHRQFSRRRWPGVDGTGGVADGWCGGVRPRRLVQSDVAARSAGSRSLDCQHWRRSATAIGARTRAAILAGRRAVAVDVRRRAMVSAADVEGQRAGVGGQRRANARRATAGAGTAGRHVAGRYESGESRANGCQRVRHRVEAIVGRAEFGGQRDNARVVAGQPLSRVPEECDRFDGQRRYRRLSLQWRANRKRTVFSLGRGRRSLDVDRSLQGVEGDGIRPERRDVLVGRPSPRVSVGGRRLAALLFGPRGRRQSHADDAWRRGCRVRRAIARP